MPDEPRRREYERRRWPDERIDDLADLVRAFGPTVTLVATHQANIDEIRSDVADFKIGQADLEARLCARMDRDAARVDKEAAAQAEFRREYRRNREDDAQRREQEVQRREQEQATRTGGRWTLWAAAIGGIAVVLASLVTALVTLLGGGAG